MTDETPLADAAQDRRQHLEFIQAVVGRMSTASTLAKGWCLTVATAALGFALTRNSLSVGLLGGLAGVLFGVMDARYLREERKFRSLYDDARRGQVEVYDMDTRPYVEPGHARFADTCRWRSVLQSWSLWGFHGPLLAVTVVVVVRVWLSR